MSCGTTRRAIARVSSRGPTAAYPPCPRLACAIGSDAPMIWRSRPIIVLVLIGWFANLAPAVSEVEGLASGTGLAQSTVEGSKYAGRPLGDVLRELQAAGLNIVFSSEIVRPTMK